MAKKYGSDEAAIRKLDAAWSKAVSAKSANKIDEVVKFYATDGSVVTLIAPRAYAVAPPFVQKAFVQTQGARRHFRPATRTCHNRGIGVP